jgi:hypothetical protein
MDFCSRSPIDAHDTVGHLAHEQLEVRPGAHLSSFLQTLKVGTPVERSSAPRTPACDGRLTSSEARRLARTQSRSRRRRHLSRSSDCKRSGALESSEPNQVPAKSELR